MKAIEFCPKSLEAETRLLVGTRHAVENKRAVVRCRGGQAVEEMMRVGCLPSGDAKDSVVVHEDRVFLFIRPSVSTAIEIKLFHVQVSDASPETAHHPAFNSIIFFPNCIYDPDASTLTHPLKKICKTTLRRKAHDDQILIHDLIGYCVCTSVHQDVFLYFF